MPRRYLQVEPGRGYPSGETISYECLRCGGIVASVQVGVAACRCANITFDIGRLDIDDETKFRIFDGKGPAVRRDNR